MLVSLSLPISLKMKYLQRGTGKCYIKRTVQTSFGYMSIKSRTLRLAMWLVASQRILPKCFLMWHNNKSWTQIIDSYWFFNQQQHLAQPPWVCLQDLEQLPHTVFLLALVVTSSSLHSQLRQLFLRLLSLSNLMVNACILHFVSRVQWLF